MDVFVTTYLLCVATRKLAILSQKQNSQARLESLDLDYSGVETNSMNPRHSLLHTVIDGAWKTDRWRVQWALGSNGRARVVVWVGNVRLRLV